MDLSDVFFDARHWRNASTQQKERYLSMLREYLFAKGAAYRERESNELRRLLRREHEQHLAPINLSGLLEDMKRRLVVSAHEQCGGSTAAMARFLGVTEKQVYSMKKRYGIEQGGGGDG